MPVSPKWITKAREVAFESIIQLRSPRVRRRCIRTTGCRPPQPPALMISSIAVWGVPRLVSPEMRLRSLSPSFAVPLLTEGNSYILISVTEGGRK